MAFRFQKRVKLLPGVTVNLSKSGVSTSVGVKGARITKGHGQTRATVGLPGSGLSQTVVSSNAAPLAAPQAAPDDDKDGTKNLIIGILFIAALIGIAALFS